MGKVYRVYVVKGHRYERDLIVSDNEGRWGFVEIINSLNDNGVELYNNLAEDIAKGKVILNGNIEYMKIPKYICLLGEQGFFMEVLDE